MKRLFVLALLSVVLTGCVKQEDYDALAKKNEKLEKKVEDLEDENEDLKAEIEQLKEQPKQLKEQPIAVDQAIHEVYNKTFTNPTSKSTISITMYLNNGDVQLMSSYQMPPHSFFRSDYEAEGAAALYCAYILTLLETNDFTSGMCESDEYYDSLISTAENDDGFIFVTSSRNGSVAYTEQDRDWYTDYMSDMENDRYSSSELAWVSETFTSFENDLTNIADRIKELKK